MLGNCQAVTRCLRIAVVILILAVLAAPLAACEDSEPGATQAETEYEDAIYEWLRVAGPSWSDFVRSMGLVHADFRQAIRESTEAVEDRFDAASQELSFDYALEVAYSLRDAMAELPDMTPPLVYEEFDIEFREAVSVMTDGLNMFIKSVEEDPILWWPDGWFNGWMLLTDGHDAFLDAFCHFPRSSSLSHFCIARFEEAP